MEREVLIKQLEVFSESRNIPYARIAKSMAIGASTLSEVRKGTYKGDVNLILDKINEYLERHKKQMKRINFCEDTLTRRKIFDVIETIKKYVASNARERILESAKIGLIVGRAGIGKTHSLQEYARTYPARCLLITAENNVSVTGMLKKVARELKVDHNRRGEEIKENIKEVLKFSETIIIVDESENLDMKVIAMLRSIADQTGIGLVLAGTERLGYNILSRKKEFEYLQSRIVTNAKLDGLKIEDVSRITKRFIGSELDLYKEKDLIELISLLSFECKGSARRLADILVLTNDIVAREENIGNTNGLLSVKYVKAVLEKIPAL